MREIDQTTAERYTLSRSTGGRFVHSAIYARDNNNPAFASSFRDGVLSSSRAVLGLEETKIFDLRSRVKFDDCPSLTLDGASATNPPESHVPRRRIPMSTDIQPFRIAATDAQLADLKRRLRETRWPEPECVDDWTQGLPLAYAQEVAAYWLDKYDWRAREERLDRFPQFKTTIDGVGIHFVHVRSPHADAMPLVMTHGWPGSIVEFQKVIEPLTNPTAHGGSASDAFHLVCPSLPGYGYSDKPSRTGWTSNVSRAHGRS